MKQIESLINNNQEWLVERMRFFINKNNFSKYTTRLEPILAKSVAGMSASLLDAVHTFDSIPELDADTDYVANNLLSFGTAEAFRHHERRVNHEVYFKLIKYFRQVYLELLRDSGLEKDYIEYYTSFIIRYYDFVEVGIFKQLASDEVALQKAYFEQLFESSPEGIIMVDNDGNIMNLNRGFEQLFGYTLEEIKALNLDKLISPEHLYDEARNLSAKVRGGELVQAETIRRDKHGTLIHVAILGYPIFVNRRQVGLYAIYSNITERKEAEAKLHYLSFHDPMTGLYNRTYFELQMKLFEETWPQQMGIIICDIDGLKIVNDTLGHDKGDNLLIVAAKILKMCVRKKDVLARIGGDEFAIFLPACEIRELESVTSRIHTAIIDYNTTQQELPLNISVGYAVTRNKTLPSVSDLFKEADNNMYREKLHRRQSNRSAIVQTLTTALEVRDFITEGHAERMQNLVRNMAESLEVPERSIKELQLLAQFHDIGKVGIPDRILFKTGPLTAEEYQEMKRHSDIGYRIAQSSPDLIPISDWILKHHEWWDGSGYPLGLSGDDIPLECRILAIADAYDAMTTYRPYKKTMTHSEAIAELIRCAGTQFDPFLVEKFISVLARYTYRLHANERSSCK